MSNAPPHSRSLLVVARPTSIDRAAAAKVISEFGFTPSFADTVAKAGWSYVSDRFAAAILIPPLDDIFQALHYARTLFPPLIMAVPLGAARAMDLPARILWSMGTATSRNEVEQVVGSVVAVWLNTREPSDEWDAPTLDALVPLQVHVEDSMNGDFKNIITQTFSLDPLAIGDPCPRCTEPLTRRENAFHGRSGYEDGAYCASCNRAWALSEGKNDAHDGDEEVLEKKV